MSQKLTLATLNAELEKHARIIMGQSKTIELLQGQLNTAVTVIENMARTINTLQGQTVEVVPACDCDKITCEECLSRAMGQHNATVSAIPAGTQVKSKQATGSQDGRPSSDTPFKTLVEFFAGRVKHNRVNKVNCQTEKLVGYNYGVTDFRFNLTRDERRLYTAARKKQDVSAKDALLALAGACERLGMK
jgi:hypothetical protein